MISWIHDVGDATMAADKANEIALVDASMDAPYKLYFLTIKVALFKSFIEKGDDLDKWQTPVILPFLWTNGMNKWKLSLVRPNSDRHKGSLIP